LTPGLTGFTGLNAVDFYPVPHFGNIPFKEAGNKIVERYGNALPLRTFGNSEYIEVIGNTVTVTHGKKLDRTTLGKAVMGFLTKTSCMTRRIGKPPLT
jgi:peptidase E